MLLSCLVMLGGSTWRTRFGRASAKLVGRSLTVLVLALGAAQVVIYVLLPNYLDYGEPVPILASNWLHGGTVYGGWWNGIGIHPFWWTVEKLG